MLYDPYRYYEVDLRIERITERLQIMSWLMFIGALSVGVATQFNLVNVVAVLVATPVVGFGVSVVGAIILWVMLNLIILVINTCKWLAGSDDFIDGI